MFKIRGPSDGEQKKKNLCLVCQVTPPSSQICNEVQKLCPWKGTGMIIFLRWMPKSIYIIIYFKLTKLSKYCLVGGGGGGGGGGGAELAPAHQMIKIAQNRSFVGLRAVSHSMPQLLQIVIKKKTKQNKTKQKGHASYLNSEYIYPIE